MGGGDLAGFEITLRLGYWRDPGDARPTLDSNVASVELQLPAPKRIREADGSEALGYDDSVVFPLRIKPRDATKPRDARLADFAVRAKKCACRPRRISSSRRIRPGFAAVAAIDAASPQCPAPFKPFQALGADSWRLCATHEDGPSRLEGWWMKVAPRGCGRRPRLLHANNRRQTERRGPSDCAQAHAHRRRGGVGDDGRGPAKNLFPLLTLGTGPLYGQAPVV